MAKEQMSIIHIEFNYTVWHTTHAMLFFSQNASNTDALVYKIFFCVILAYNEVDVTICKQP
jgi:hypothetical protein